MRLPEIVETKDRWTFGPCIWLGLHNEAWQIQAAHENSVLVPRRLGHEVDTYVRWLLGYSPRPAPAGVTAKHRWQATFLLGQTAVLHPQSVPLVAELARQPGSVCAPSVIPAIGRAAIRSVLQMRTITPKPRAKIDPNRDGSTEDANMNPFRKALQGPRDSRLEICAQVAQDLSHPGRDDAIKELTRMALTAAVSMVSMARTSTEMSDL